MASASANGTSGDDVDGENKDPRMKQYKNVAKHEDMRRRRNECSVELRKQKRDETLMKRRNVAEGADDLDSDTSILDDSTAQPTDKGSSELDALMKTLCASPSLEEARTCFATLRRMLSRSKCPPVDEVIQSGMLTALIQALTYPDEKVQFEAAWGLTNIVSGTTEQTKAAVDGGAVPKLVALCSSDSARLAEQATWALANVAGDCGALRDHVVQHGFMDALEKFVEHLDELTTEFARTLAWCFSNLCRHRNPAPNFETLARIAPCLTALMQHADQTVRQDSCWAASYLTDGSDEQIALAHRCGFVPPVMKMLQNGADTEVAPALRVLGNFATGADDLTQVVVDNGVMELLMPVCARTSSQAIVKESCWLISNVIAGTRPQIQAAIDAGLIDFLVHVLGNGDMRAKMEASWAIANLAQGGSPAQIMELCKRSYMPVLCDLLRSKSADMLVNILESLYSVLATAGNVFPEKLKTLLIIIEECGAVDKLEELQESPNEKVYQLAYKIIESFFSEDDDDEKDEMPADIPKEEPFNF